MYEPLQIAQGGSETKMLRVSTEGDLQHLSSQSSQQSLDSLREKEVLLDALLQMSDDAICWIMCHAMLRRPSLEQLLEARKWSMEAERKTMKLPEIRPSLRGNMEKEHSHFHGVPVLQFTAPRVFVPEDESHVEVRVFRVGSSKGRSEVYYTTRDVTAIAGKDYKATQGLLVFHEAEMVKSVLVHLMDDTCWNPNREFHIELLSEGLVHARLEKYLAQTTVVVVDDDPFPTQQYKDFIREGKLDEIPNIGLVIEYLRMQWGHDGIRHASVKIILSDMLDNVLFLSKALLQMYLVDHVLNVEVLPSSLFIPNERYYTLACVSTVLVVPHILVHYLEWLKPFGLDGESLKLLQKSLFDRYLNYVPAAAEEEDILLAVSRDAVDVVTHVYHGALKVFALLGRVMMICFIQLVAPAIFQQSVRLTTLIPLFIFPFLMFLFLIARDSVSTSVLYERLRTNDEFIGFVEEAVNSQRLVSECGARDMFIDICDAKFTAHSKAVKQAHQVMANNQEFAEWTSILLLAFYTLTAGAAVVKGEVTLGRFVTNLHIFSGMGKVYSEIYSHVLLVQAFVPGLRRLTRLMNIPTEWDVRAEMSTHLNAQSDQLFAALAPQDNSGEPLVDQLPVCIGDVTFRYDVRTVQHGSQSYSWLSTLESNQEGMHFKHNMRLAQGQLIQLIGPHREGKTTLLKLIGGVLVPKVSEDMLHSENPRFFVPPHFTLCYVPGEPVFLRSSLLDNLTLGVKRGSADGSLTRVSEICDELGLLGSISCFLESDHDHSWTYRLSHTEQLLLCLARGLIANPQLLCVERHAMNFNQQTAKRVLQILRDHVDERGLSQDNHHRRPRTCIMTGSDKSFGVEFIDCTYCVSRAKGIQLVHGQEDQFGPALSSLALNSSRASLFNYEEKATRYRL